MTVCGFCEDGALKPSDRGCDMFVVCPSGHERLTAPLQTLQCPRQSMEALGSAIVRYS